MMMKPTFLLVGIVVFLLPSLSLSATLIIPTAFRFPNFLNHANLNFIGDARNEVQEIIVAGPGRAQTGAIWFNQAFNLKDGFFTEFATSASTQTDNDGKFGFAFVFQSESDRVLGLPAEGFGYSGLGEGFAIEFAHDYVDIRDALFPGSKLRPQTAAGSGGRMLPYPNLLSTPLNVKLELNPTPVLQLTIQISDSTTNKVLIRHVHKLENSLYKDYFIGFTASTDFHSASRFAVKNWKFGASSFQGCVRGFNGPECGMTNEEAALECPRRNTCLGCVRSVYNCVWCDSSCIVGTSHCNTNRLVLEEMGCSTGLTYMWLWIVLGLISLVFCFGIILLRILHRNQAQRAIGLLISLSIGAVGGMFLSLCVAASLVEISTNPFFSVAFGLFFFYLTLLLSRDVNKVRSAEGVVKVLSLVWIAIAGVLCFVLDRELILWMPETLKIVCFMLLSSALTFCLVFASVDVLHELWQWRLRKANTGSSQAIPFESEKQQEDNNGLDNLGRIFIVGRNKASYAFLIFGSIVSGLYFGLVFGLMRIEEEELYRASLLLRRESLYTFPFGAIVGGLSGLLIQFVALLPPANTDYDVERIIEEARDDL